MARAYSRHHVALGRAVRALREERGWSQEELAYQTKLHRNYIGRVERGELNLSFDRVVRLADAFKLTLLDLAARYQSELR